VLQCQQQDLCIKLTMAITAASSDQSIIYGSFKLDLSDVTPLTTSVFSPRTQINTDLDTTPYPPSRPSFWTVNWYLNLFAENVTGNPSLFADALQKFNLGYVAITWRGQHSYSEYWNYKSQRFKVCCMWTPTSETAYPSEYTPPARISDAEMLNLSNSEFSANIDSRYGDKIYLQWTNASIPSSTAWVYYQAQCYVNATPPLSLGDI